MILRSCGAGIALLLVTAGLAVGAGVPPSGSPPAPHIVFATIAEAKAVLGARDDYVRATAPLERSAKLRTTEAVDEERLIRHMQETAREWTEEQRKNVAPLIERLAQFLQGIQWKMPGRMLIIQADVSLEDGAPHTRGNAMVVPTTFYSRGPGAMAYVLSHEVFHILTRNNGELKEKLYAAIGFRRCGTVVIPPAISKLRVTNPDAVESLHTISVHYQGQPVEALPYIRFGSEDIDPRTGFMKNIQVAWLLVDRKGTECRARGGAQDSVPPEQLEGLYEQVGRNTAYLFHPEEILADNFSRLFFAALGGPAQSVASPEILEKLRKILFEGPAP